MRAIGRVFFFAAALAGAACSPDLARSSAVLAIRVVGLPREAATVRATVGNGASSFRVEADVASFDGELVAESVPTGQVAVVVEATTPLAVLHREATTNVAGPLTRLEIDFGGSASSGADAGVTGDGGPSADAGSTVAAPMYSNPIPHVVRGLRPSAVVEGVLSGSVAAGASEAYPRFIDSATSRFGRAPGAFEVSSVDLALLDGTASQVSNLQNLWRDEVIVSLVAQGTGTEVELARGAPNGDLASLTVTATRSSLAPLAAALAAGTFDVRVRGAADREGDFYADVRVSVVYVAYDR